MPLRSAQLAVLLAVLVSTSASAQVSPATPPSEGVELENPAFPSFPVPSTRPLTALADLLPTPAVGAKAQAAAALEAGQPGVALRLLSGLPSDSEVLFLRTLASLRLTPTAELAATMEGLALQFPAVADRCALYAALAREELGELPQAQRLFANVPAQSLVSSEARLGLARVLRRMGNSASAAAALAPLASGAAPANGKDIAAEALLLRAELARDQRDGLAERAELLQLWTRHPHSGFSPEAERRLAGHLTLAAEVERAEVLVDSHRSAEALRLLETLRLAPPDALGCRAQLARGRALRKEHRHAEVERVLAPVASGCADAEVRVRALYVLATSQALLHPEAAVATYESLAQQFPQHPYADDALYLAAELRAAAGDIAGALASLEAVASRYSDGDFAGEALFKTFWLHHRLEDDRAGLAALDRIEALFAQAQDPYDVERARYWRGRVLDAQADQTSAMAVWTALAREHPTTYYGLLARTRLTERDPAAAVDLAQQAVVARPGAEATRVDVGALPNNAHYRAALQLSALGFTEAASQELLAIPRSDQPRDVARVVVQALARVGDFRSAQALARTELAWALKGPVVPELRDVWDAAYPRAYRDLVERYCKSPRVDPDLLQALMREESALDPRALSWAGALGLTQLMLPTAQAVARELRLGKPSSEALFDPALNIQLGATYLGRLLARFGGNPVLALASYNAGASNVDHWRAARSGLELDAFVEEIPLAETRGYVKRVLRSYNTYRLLGGQQAATSTEAPQASANPVQQR